MQRLFHFSRLIRINNLLFIVLTQYLLRYCIILPVFNFYGTPPAMTHLDFFILSLSTVLIAAAGYIINDYFDLQTDRINKPERITIGRVFKRRWAMVWHWAMNAAGLLMGIYAAWRVGVWWLPVLHVVAILLLLFYSTTFKGKLLVGNILVSFLIALVIGIVALFDSYYLLESALIPGDKVVLRSLLIVFIFSFSYATFAFVINMIREIVKDMEDIKGDAEQYCQTLPLVIGLQHTKLVVYGLAIALILFIGFLQVVQMSRGLLLINIYALILVQLPLLRMMVLLRKADRQRQFKQLSYWVKLIMLAGVFSMLVLYLLYNPENYI